MALANEETLHSSSKLAAEHSRATETRVNSVKEADDDPLINCDLHGKGRHGTDECKMLIHKTVVFDSHKKSYVYSDTGLPYKGGVKSSQSDKAHAEGPKKKKNKSDKPQGKDWKKGKKEKEVPKDKKEKKKDKQEKKQHQKVGKVIDGLRTTIVTLIQSQSSSSSTAAAPTQAPAQAGPPPDGPIITALDKNFADLKKSIGLEDP